MQSRVCAQRLAQRLGRGAENGGGIGLVLRDADGGLERPIGPQQGHQIAARVDHRRDHRLVYGAAVGDGRFDSGIGGAGRRSRDA